ncbi:hypothetical protein Tco_1210048 [Tanacetum coccineum]
MVVWCESGRDRSVSEPELNGLRSATDDREFVSRIKGLLQEMVVTYDDRVDFIREMEVVSGVVTTVKTAEFLNETLWKDDRKLQKLQNLEMDANKRAF